MAHSPWLEEGWMIDESADVGDEEREEEREREAFHDWYCYKRKQC